MALILDTRQGLAESINLDIQYENEKQISTAADGLPISVFFDSLPWVIKRTTTKYIGDLTSWTDAIDEQEVNNREFAITNTGFVTESVNMGSSLMYEGQLFYDGQIVIADYRNGTSDVSGILKELQASSGSLNISGYWPLDGDVYPTAVYFSESRVGLQGTYSYTASEAVGSIGATATYGGVTGFITNISTSNPRYISGSIFYDIVEVVSESNSAVIGSI